MTAPLLPPAEPLAFRLPWRVMLPMLYPTGVIPLADIAEQYLGINERLAKERAAACDLGLPVFRLGSNKSPWVVSVDDFADFVERRAEEARIQWRARVGRAA